MIRLGAWQLGAASRGPAFVLARPRFPVPPLSSSFPLITSALALRGQSSIKSIGRPLSLAFSRALSNSPARAATTPTTATTTTGTMTSAQQHGKDICELIKEEHRNMFQILNNIKKSGISKQEQQKQCFLLIKEGSVHTANEEELLYPLFKEKLAGKGKDFYDRSINEHTQLKKVLYDIDQTDCNPDDPKFCDRLKEVETVLTRHKQMDENEIFPELCKVVDKPTMVELGKKWIDNKGNLPTRPHPDAPIGKLVDRAIAMTDWARDKIRFGGEMGQQPAVPQHAQSQQQAMPQTHASK